MDAMRALGEWAVQVNTDLTVWEDDEDRIAQQNNAAMAEVMGAMGMRWDA